VKSTLSQKVTIGYGIVHYGTTNSGVFKKISDQVAQWKKMDIVPHLFVITDTDSINHWLEIDCEIEILVDSSFLKKIWNRIKLLSLAKNSEVNLLYVRDVFPIFYPKLEVPIVLEVQSSVFRELSQRRKILSRIYRKFSYLLYRRVNGAVYVTNELLEKNEAQLRDSCQKIVIGNGIDLSRIVTLGSGQQGRPSLFFVGHPNQSWHGVEHMIKFAEVHTNVDLHIVGYEFESKFSNIFSHGMLNETLYIEIAKSCVAGVASLELSSIGMKDASPLKSREYLALGLPLISRYKDPDFTPSPDFILELPQDGSEVMIHSDQILQFLNDWNGKRVQREQIAHIDVSKKELQRVRFFKEVINNKGLLSTERVG
jgi:hypothetical protein